MNGEIKKLEERIKDIDGIEAQKERLLARMEVIEDLQQSRPEVVHLFDQLTRSLPDGVHLESVTQNGRSVRLSGVAQSSTRVSSYMRNVDDSDWLDKPDLVKIETLTGGRQRERFSFELSAAQKNPNADTEEAE